MEMIAFSESLDAFCRKWKIAELRVFGSAARGELTPESDIDFLYRFEPGTVIGLDVIDAIEELKGITGRDVDFISLEAVECSANHYGREMILGGSRIIYPHAA